MDMPLYSRLVRDLRTLPAESRAGWQLGAGFRYLPARERHAAPATSGAPLPSAVLGSAPW